MEEVHKAQCQNTRFTNWLKPLSLLHSGQITLSYIYLTHVNLTIGICESELFKMRFIVMQNIVRYPCLQSLDF
jgi:hypothetical protein